MPVGTAFHERTFPLCHSLNYREWSGYYTVSVYEVHHEHEYNAIRNAAALIDISPLFKYLITAGDAARFVDPIFSTGVSIAMNSARFASRDIVQAAARGSFDRDSFTTFESTIRRGTRNWYNFISVYYRLNVLFTYYIREPKYRLDVLKLLQGDVYDEDEPEVLLKMRDTVTDIERRPQHPWHKLLNGLTNQAFSPQF